MAIIQKLLDFVLLLTYELHGEFLHYKKLIYICTQLQMYSITFSTYIGTN